MDWVLTKGLQNLRSQVNARWPDRDKASDGSIGDAAHAAGTSGHNPDDSPYGNAAWQGDPDTLSEVRAWDMDNDLREPGTTGLDIVDHVRRLPGVGTVLRYMIYDRKIYHVRNGFAQAAYTGPSPHTEHIHFEGAWTQAADNNTTFDFQLEKVGEMALTEAQTKAAAKAGASEALFELLNEGYRAATGGAPDAGSDAQRAENRRARNVRDFLRGIVGGPTEDDVATARAAIQEQLKTIGSVTLTDAQAERVAAGVIQAIRPVEAKVDALREHLGDEG